LQKVKAVHNRNIFPGSHLLKGMLSDEKSPLLENPDLETEEMDQHINPAEMEASDDQRLMMHYDLATQRRKSRSRPRDFLQSCFAGSIKNWKSIGAGLLLLISVIVLTEMNAKLTYILLGPGEPTFEQLTSLMNEHSSFINVFTDPADHTLFALDFSAEFLAQQKPVVFSAIFYRGTLNEFSDETESYLYMPAENTDETVFQFQLTDDEQGVDVVRCGLTMRTHDPNMEDVTKKSQFEGWETTLPVMATRGSGDEKRFLVDASELLDFGFYVTDLMPPILVEEPRVVLNETQSFPHNFDVVAEYKIMADPEAMTTLDVALMFSVAKLPDEEMSPRVSDERVGYFTTVYTDLGDYRSEETSTRASNLVDKTVSIIERRRLEKGKPLIYYIDPTVPEQWRQAMREGVENWQPAFEAIGFGSEAIKAVLPGDDEWPDDYHVGDVRFNTISWAIDTDSVFALGPSTVDPRSGEILKSNIVFTNGWLKSWLNVFETLDPATQIEANGRRALSEDTDFHHHLWSTADSHFHEVDFHSHSHVHTLQEGHPLSKIMGQQGFKFSVRSHNWRACRQSRLSNPSMELARVALSLKEDGAVPDDIIAQGWTDVTMHEVGHTLGLRHNFKGSTGVSMEQLSDTDFTGENGLTSSVMDYLPLNIIGIREEAEMAELDYFSPVIGEYDMWAIEYGYAEVEDESTSETGSPLAAIAEKNMPFGTDEDGARAEGADPHNVAFDLSDDPVRYYEEGIMELVKRLRPSLLDRAVYVGEPFHYYSAYERALLNQIRYAGIYLAKFVGGYNITKQRRLSSTHEGPLQVYDVEKQRAALNLIMKVLVEEDSSEDNSMTLLPRAEHMPFLVQQDGQCEGLMQYCYGITPYEILEKVDLLRAQVLENLLSPERLARLRLTEWYGKTTDQDHIPMTELFNTITEAVWGESLANSPEVEDNRNWATQSFYLDLLIKLQCEDFELSGEIHGLMAGELYTIKSSIDTFMNSTDAASQTAYPQVAAAQRKINVWLNGNAFCEVSNADDSTRPSSYPSGQF